MVKKIKLLKREFVPIVLRSRKLSSTGKRGYFSVPIELLRSRQLMKGQSYKITIELAEGK